MSTAASEPESQAAAPAASAPAAEPPADDAWRTPDRSLLAVAAGIAALVVLALAVLFTRGEPAPLDERTPAGVVQRYSAAVIAGDESAAGAYLSDSAKNTCSTVDRMPAENLRITLVSTTERPDTADVRVLITVAEGSGPFGSSEYQVEGVFDLVKTGGRWLVSRAPWPVTVCPGLPVTVCPGLPVKQ